MEDKSEEVKSQEKSETKEETTKDKKKVSLGQFKVKSFVTEVKVDQMQFLNTAGG